MSIVNGYVTLPDFKAAVGDSATTRDAAYEQAIEAASRQIDEFCHRVFWRTTSASPREFHALTPTVVHTDDIATTTGLAVEVYDGAGVWVPTTGWAPSPAAPFNGRPISRLVSYDGLFPVATRPTVRVTAVWGWPAVPPQVRMACQILAVDHYKSKDLTGGIAGFGEVGPVRIAAFSPQARSLLERLQLRTEPC